MMRANVCWWVSWGGAVGTLAALGKQAPAVKKGTLERLGLKSSTEAWHTARDNVCEVCSVLTIVAGTVAKIANEIVLLGRTEIGEVREPSAGRQTASSSTMPHKRNPVLCQRVVVLWSHVRGLLSVVMEAMVHENERDPRSLWAEWLAVPQIVIYTGTALAYTKAILADLEVFPERMLANLHTHKDLAASEWLLFRLGAKIGKMQAQEVLHTASQRALQEGQSLTDILRADSKWGSLLQDEDFAIAAAPEGYVGLSGEIVDAVVGAPGSGHGK